MHGTNFESYKNDPHIIAMTALNEAYERRDIKEAERIFAGMLIYIYTENSATLTDDAFVQEFLTPVLHELRVRYILDYIKPYGAVRMDKLASVCALRYG